MDFTPDERTCVMAGYRGQVLARSMVTREGSSFVENMPNIGCFAFSHLGDGVAVSCERLCPLGGLRFVAGRRHAARVLHAVHSLCVSGKDLQHRVCAGLSELAIGANRKASHEGFY